MKRYLGYFFSCLLMISFSLSAGLFSKHKKKKKKPKKIDKISLLSINHENVAKEYPITENKSFVVVIPSYNADKWIEKSLSSVFDQDYDNYRIVYIDNCSDDTSALLAKQMIEKHNMHSRVTYIKNEKRISRIENLYKAIHPCKNDEIVVVLEGGDFFAREDALSLLNKHYQNPYLWLTYGNSIAYPSFQLNRSTEYNLEKLQESGFRNYSKSSFCNIGTFYAGLFKKIRLEDLLYEATFTKTNDNKYIMLPLLELASDNFRYISDILFLDNIQNRVDEPSIISKEIESYLKQKGSYKHLKNHPYTTNNESFDVDTVIFSFDRPMQLYATLESMERWMTNNSEIYVIYRFSEKKYNLAYKELHARFPKIHFVCENDFSRKNFKQIVLETTFLKSTSNYIMFAVDDNIVKGSIDLKKCASSLHDTGAYGFYLKMGNHINYCGTQQIDQKTPIHVHYKDDIYAWIFNQKNIGLGDWEYPNSVDMVVYNKKDLKDIYYKIDFKNPNRLEGAWDQNRPSNNHLGLYCDISKLVNIPVNAISENNCQVINEYNQYSTAWLLDKFNQGYKIDISPIGKISNNRSVHIDYPLDFVKR
jgi:glycosyltransferase involved in cell wall biosynthesis